LIGHYRFIKQSTFTTNRFYQVHTHLLFNHDMQQSRYYK
jgi:hypothetical protein